MYTRYADDLTFSTKHKNILFDVTLVVKEQLVKLFGNAMRINRRKTIFTSKAHNRHVTGITVNNDGNLSIGRVRKKYIKHLVHQFQFNQLDRENIHHLRGLIAFAKHIEPGFLQSLKKIHSGAN